MYSLAVLSGYNVYGQNNAPVLNNTADLEMTDLSQAESDPAGDLISDILDSDDDVPYPVTDADAGDPEGIAIFAVDGSNGVWEYSTDNGSIWNEFDFVSTSQALLLASDITTRVRFVPDQSFLGVKTAALRFYAWDQTDGSVNGSFGDVTQTGGNTAFSAEQDSARLSVNNVAPLLDNSGQLVLRSVNVNNTNPPGDNITEILLSAGGDPITDSQLGAPEGIAVISVYSGSDGDVQYSTDDGANWSTLGMLSFTNALLLAADIGIRLRFLPSGPATGTINNVVMFHAWDQTEGATGDIVDLTGKTGDTQAFSTASETVDISVKADELPSYSPVNITAALASLDHSSVAWGDYNADGDLDFVLSGSNASNMKMTRLYQSDGADAGPGDWLFSEVIVSPQLVDVDSSSCAWGDYDNDGDIDLLLAGSDGSHNAVTKIYENHGGSNLTEAASLEGIVNGTVLWFDYDNDGDLDVLITGKDTSGQPFTGIYENNAGFTAVAAGLEPLVNSSAAVADYDNDGDLDIVLSGEDAMGMSYTALWENSGGTFTVTAHTFEPLSNGSAAFGDYNNDGFADLIITGENNSGVPQTRLYRNSGSGFTETGTFTGVATGNAIFGDYDNDGDLDIVLTGADNTGNPFIQVYRYDGNDMFTADDGGLPAVQNGNISFADYDGDTQLDLLVMGNDGTVPVTALQNNTLAQTNTTPLAPEESASLPEGNDVVFFWQDAYDRETPYGGISYNLRVGTASGGNDVFSSMATGSGKRLITERGIDSVFWRLEGLARGIYYWSVQAIDAGGLASGFSAEQTFKINTPPTGRNNTVSFNEDNSYTFTQNDFGYSDAADVAPDPFSGIRITWLPDPDVGKLFFSGTEIDQINFVVDSVSMAENLLVYIPEPDVNGTDSFQLQVYDGEDYSIDYTMDITIDPVNDAPVFTIVSDPPAVNEDVGPQMVPLAENIASAPPAGSSETGQVLTFSVVNVNTVSGDLAFTSEPSLDASNGYLSYETMVDTHGSAEVTVRLADDGSSVPPNVNISDEVTFTITVNAVNDAPSVSASEVVLNEDAGEQTITGWATFEPGATNESDQNVLSYTITNLSDPASVLEVAPAVDNSGTLTFTVRDNAFGEVTFDIEVADDGPTGGDNVHTSTSTGFKITVNAINDQPSFTAGDPPVVNEDAGPQTVNSWAVFDAGGNETQGVLQYTVTNISNASLFASGGMPVVDNAGTLTYTPNADASGTSTFEVTVRDDGGTANGGVDTSEGRTFTITVNEVNDAPDFTASSPATILEDGGLQTISGWASFDPGPALESVQHVESYSVSNISNPALFQFIPTVETDGTLTFTPADDAFGTSTFDVTVTDDGGTLNGGENTSAVKTFTITVDPVNDAPDFTAFDPLPLLVNADPVVIFDWAGFDPGAFNETSQTAAAFVVTNISDPTMFAALPQVNTNGDLTFETAPDREGQSTFEVYVQDDGGTANGGVDVSERKTFTISVNRLNRQPSFSAVDPPASDEDAGQVEILGWSDFDPGAAGESGQQVREYLISNVSNPALFSVLPAVDNFGTLTYTSATDAFGTSTFDVAVRDDGGTENGGVDTSLPMRFAITVNPVNDPPRVVSSIANQTALEDQLYTFTLPAGTFVDIDEMINLSYSAELEDGSPLPAWLSFNVLTLEFSGTPDNTDVGSYRVKVIVRDSEMAETSDVFRLNVINGNDNPTDITLDNSSIAENLPAGTVIGFMNTLDQDQEDEHVYSLVSGEGSDDNDKFRIVSNQLQSARIFDFETQTTHRIRIRSDDQKGGAISVAFVIQVSANNTSPGDIALSSDAIREGNVPGATVGFLSTLDPDVNEAHLYELVSGQGSDDNTIFTIEDRELRVSEVLDFETRSLYRVRIRSTDASGDFLEKTFEINVTDDENDLITSLDTDREDRLYIYPNPFTDHLIIEAPVSLTSVTLQMVNVHGTLVFDRKVTGYENSIRFIPPSGLESGFYFLRLIFNDHYWVRGVIKK